MGPDPSIFSKELKHFVEALRRKLLNKMGKDAVECQPVFLFTF